MLDNNEIHVAQLRLRRQHRVVAGKQLNLRSARQADELRLLCRADVLNTSPARAEDAASNSRIWILWWWADRRVRLRAAMSKDADAGLSLTEDPRVLPNQLNGRHRLTVISPRLGRRVESKKDPRTSHQ